MCLLIKPRTKKRLQSVQKESKRERTGSMAKEPLGCSLSRTGWQQQSSSSDRGRRRRRILMSLCGFARSLSTRALVDSRSITQHSTNTDQCHSPQQCPMREWLARGVLPAWKYPPSWCVRVCANIWSVHACLQTHIAERMDVDDHL